MIAIIGAMDEEVLAIVNLMDRVEKYDLFNINLIKGYLNQKEVIVFKSGIGLTNAAISTSIVLSQYKIDTVINIGTAGSLKDEVKVLDVVVSNIVTYHDFDISVFGNPRSFSIGNRFVYQADLKLIEKAKKCIEDHVHVGPIISGNQFISTQKQIDEIEMHFPEALCVEMEAASIAHTCAHFNVPFIILRSISDQVKSNENNISFTEYLQKASQRSAQFAYNFVEYL